jgi:hypothetical protein
VSVTKPRRLLPRCSGVTTDNTQCGRRVADGSNPPLCHIHAAISRGQAVSPLTDTGDEIDEVKILKRLARDSNPQVRLRAVDLLLEVKRKNRDRADEKAATGPTMRDFLLVLTPSEREEVADLIVRLRALQRRVYEKRPDLRPPTWAPDVAPAADVVPDAIDEPREEAAPVEVEPPSPIVETEGEEDVLVIG